MPYEPEDFLSPQADNPWMVTAAHDWIADVNGEPGEHDTSLNLFVWSKSHPDSAFLVIQTILEFTSGNEALFIQAAAGPLETFLSRCPDDFIETVWQVARIDPRLRKAFQHVWQCGMSDERYKRVQEFADQEL